jgi:hypothetical protein
MTKDTDDKIKGIPKLFFKWGNLFSILFFITLLMCFLTVPIHFTISPDFTLISNSYNKNKRTIIKYSVQTNIYNKLVNNSSVVLMINEKKFLLNSLNVKKTVNKYTCSIILPRGIDHLYVKKKKIKIKIELLVKTTLYKEWCNTK